MELRAVSELSVNGKKIVGRPVLYNTQSENLGGFVEVIAPGAFADSLTSDIRALVEHDQKLILGRTASGTLRIFEDNQGLLVEIDPPDTQSARDLLISIERGDIRGMSFGFSVPSNGDAWDYSQIPVVRTVNKALLHEVTITSLPAYIATDVHIASRALKTYCRNGQVIHREYLALMEVM